MQSIGPDRTQWMRSNASIAYDGMHAHYYVSSNQTRTAPHDSGVVDRCRAIFLSVVQDQGLTNTGRIAVP